LAFVSYGNQTNELAVKIKALDHLGPSFGDE